MQSLPNVLLYLAALLTFCAALLHFVCVFWGANGFRLLGAGKSIVQMAERGHWYPNFTAITVGLILTICSMYAFFAAREYRYYLLPKLFCRLLQQCFLSVVLLFHG